MFKKADEYLNKNSIPDITIIKKLELNKIKIETENENEIELYIQDIIYKWKSSVMHTDASKDCI